ncbi:MAG: Response regulator UvrY [Alphaproteobacteria bacterium ADurb.BinA305]|jgi:two-component system invasion response regulator UvrY|nr:MAG: Response regulator UvrY [Alphaproteobacteria bacterium ADurb.BinA305]
MIRVLLVDDHEIFRSGLKRLLADEGDITVAGEAKDAESALAFLRRHSVDTVMLDINMPGASGLDALCIIRKAWPTLPVLMLSMYREKLYAQHARLEGAQGYVTKDSAADNMLRAVRALARGERWFDGVLDDAELRSQGDVPPHTRLSAREFDVFTQIVRGVPLTQIAQRMEISVKTVATHRRRVLDKLGLNTNAEMIGYALCYQLESKD